MQRLGGVALPRATKSGGTLSTFDSTKTPLGEILLKIVDGELQLPDFQRGWVWDDEHIRSLLVSIARSFPIGAVMLLETGGEAKFQVRPVEGVSLHQPRPASELLLDGQQRLTSLTQVLKLDGAVQTRDAKKRDLKLHYYFDIERALEGPERIEDALIAVDEHRQVRTNFGRDIALDLSSREKEIEAFCFPCREILDSSAWEYALVSFPEKFAKFINFRRRVLDPFRNYALPVIRLKRETPKEAVCLVFEKVNTGGVPLSVFELVTATWAVDGFNLREDWFGDRLGSGGRFKRLGARPLLREVQPTDFLQGISLLDSYERRMRDLGSGRSGKEVTGVTAKREHILELPLSSFTKWAEPLTNGLVQAERFLRSEGFHNAKFLPYGSQLIPLGAVMAHLGERWLEPKIRVKIAQWFWCGVLGELYGGSVETRVALDLQQLLAWVLDPAAPEPATVQTAGFHPNRLDTLRSRTSAAYRGLYVLLQREGAADFFWKARIVELDRDEAKLDIHHIFPKQWCKEAGISPLSYDSIVNKTAISYKANRMIGGSAPSVYLMQLQRHEHVQLAQDEMDAILRTHLIEPSILRADAFDAFYASRKAALLAVVERAMGKAASAPTSPWHPAEDPPDEADDPHPT